MPSWKDRAGGGIGAVGGLGHADLDHDGAVTHAALRRDEFFDVDVDVDVVPCDLRVGGQHGETKTSGLGDAEAIKGPRCSGLNDVGMDLVCSDRRAASNSEPSEPSRLSIHER